MADGVPSARSHAAGVVDGEHLPSEGSGRGRSLMRRHGPVASGDQMGRHLLRRNSSSADRSSFRPEAGAVSRDPWPSSRTERWGSSPAVTSGSRWRNHLVTTVAPAT